MNCFFFGFRIGISIDRFSILFLVLELIIFPLVVLSIQKEKHLSENMESQYLYGLLLILLSLTFVFCVDDLLVLFIFFELSVVPFFFFMGVLGGAKRKLYAFLLLFFFTLFGSVCLDIIKKKWFF